MKNLILLLALVLSANAFASKKLYKQIMNREIDIHVNIDKIFTGYTHEKNDNEYPQLFLEITARRGFSIYDAKYKNIGIVNLGHFARAEEVELNQTIILEATYIAQALNLMDNNEENLELSFALIERDDSCYGNPKVYLMEELEVNKDLKFERRVSRFLPCQTKTELDLTIKAVERK